MVCILHLYRAQIILLAVADLNNGCFEGETVSPALPSLRREQKVAEQVAHMVEIVLEQQLQSYS